MKPGPGFRHRPAAALEKGKNGKKRDRNRPVPVRFRKSAACLNFRTIPVRALAQVSARHAADSHGPGRVVQRTGLD
ncbi:MAG: hypothetical protein KKH79_07075 [Candidatus Thermoplasmatota archaeon]|nr:hypothetical protein [Candidatus Thermoplasmatota archaeon]